MQEHGCTALHGVPTMFVSELELLETGQIPLQGFQRLRTGIAAGSSVPLQLMMRLHKTLNLTQLSRFRLQQLPVSRTNGMGWGRVQRFVTGVPP